MKVGYAVLYEDGTLTISKDYTLLSKSIYKDYGEFEDTKVPWYYDKKKIETVRILNQVKVSCMNSWFIRCKNLTTLTTFKNLNVSDCKDFSYLFHSCQSLRNISSLKHLDVSNGKDFSDMFSECNSLKDISALINWNVSNGEDFSFMFDSCKTLIDISTFYNWNVFNGKNFFMDVFFLFIIKRYFIIIKLECV